jgi:signal transduction histidine kinase
MVGLANHAVLVARDGRAVPIADSGAPIRDKHGHIQGAVLVFRDVTKEKQHEMRLLQAKAAAEMADRTKSEFLAAMSHELRTPLNVIFGYTDILLDGGYGSLTDKQADIVQRIDKNAHMLFDLISMVLDLNRLEAGRLPVEITAVRVADFLQDLALETQCLREQSGLEFVWRVPDSLPTLHTDPGKLKVVLKNLMVNAVKFTSHGCITVEASYRENGIEISVTDTGVGIPPEDLSLIFEAFRQAKETSKNAIGGVGLGLHIVQRFLELLGGNISVESKVGRGSIFRVWIPCNRNPVSDFSVSAAARQEES